MQDQLLSQKTGQLDQKKIRDVKKIRELSEDFEAIFMQIVLKSMRQAVQKSGLIDGGNGEEIFRSMLDQEYAKSFASQRSTGLADAIERHLLGVQAMQAQAGGVKESTLPATEAIKRYQR